MAFLPSTSALSLECRARDLVNRPTRSFLEERSDPVVDVFAAVVGVEAEDRERKGQQQPLEQRDQEALEITHYRTDELELGDSSTKLIGYTPFSPSRSPW